jgi:hypothetical protein
MFFNSVITLFLFSPSYTGNIPHFITLFYPPPPPFLKFPNDSVWYQTPGRGGLGRGFLRLGSLNRLLWQYNISIHVSFVFSTAGTKDGYFEPNVGIPKNECGLI